MINNRWDTGVQKSHVTRSRFDIFDRVPGADRFFLKQAGEWNAIRFVSDKFCKSFADGRSKLNRLSGEYHRQ